MLNKIFTVALTTVYLIACESDKSSAPVIACAPGTQLNATRDACEPDLSDGLSVNEAGQIIVDVMGDDTQTAIENAREEGRAEGVVRWISPPITRRPSMRAASVTLNCADGTA